MYKFIKFFVYFFVILTILYVGYVVESNITTPTYNYTYAIEQDYEEEIIAYATENNVNIYQQYNYVNNWTPFYFNLNGEEFEHAKPLLGFNAAKDFYLLEGDEEVKKNFEEFLVSNNIHYTVTQPIGETYATIQLEHIVMIIFSLSMLFLVVSFNYFRSQKKVFVKRINGISDFKIYLRNENVIPFLFIAGTCSFIFYTITLFYFSIFMFLWLILSVIITLIIEYLFFKICTFTNGKANIFLTGIFLLFVPFILFSAVAQLKTLKPMFEQIVVHTATYEYYKDYNYVISGGYIETPTEIPEIILEADKLGYFYEADYAPELNVDTINSDSTYPTNPTITVNDNFLIDNGLEELLNYDVYIPKGTNTTLFEDMNYYIYDTDIQVFDLDPILFIKTEPEYIFPFFLDQKFDYTQYQGNGNQFYYAVPASTFYTYEVTMFLMFLLEIVSKFIAFFLILFTLLYVLINSFIDKHKEKLVVNIINGKSYIQALSGLYSNLAIIFFTTTMINLLLTTSILRLIMLSIVWFIILYICSLVAKRRIKLIMEDL